ncbi:MAG: tryptophan--tRNA ligase [Elusimicrobiota bacterium]
MSKKTIVLSGMRPTGRLHLGNYLGALENWVKLQDDYECYFEIADWHALMSNYKNPGKVKEWGFEMLCIWLAAGLDPQKCVMFRQSDVSEHLEFYFILSAITPLGWLQRCPTYKEALENLKESEEIRNYAFLGYPVLQAADIAIYRAHKVPVGVDQLPHLEITREIIRRFNYLYKTDFLPEPQDILNKIDKLKGIDGRKMSKSYKNTIYLNEEDKALKKKINSMITDPQRIHPDDKGNPEVCTVYEYHKIFSKKEKEDINKKCRAGKIGCVQCKKILHKNLSEIIAPIRKNYLKIKENPEKAHKILEEGNLKASQKAAKNLSIIREKMNYD